jgi:Cft2 family RNA processing exonuclease
VPGVDVEFINAGHLLGSAYARVPSDARRCCSAATWAIWQAGAARSRCRSNGPDVLLVESTYGDRLHDLTIEGTSSPPSSMRRGSAAAS